MEIVINPASILAANPTQLLQTYQNIHASSEDPASQVLQRHMIGVTTHQSYTLTVRHDSDRTRELKYQVGDIFIFPAGASHWAAWQDSYGSILSIDVALFDRHMQQFLEGKKFHLRSQFQIRDPLITQLILTLTNLNHHRGELFTAYRESLYATLIYRLVDAHSDIQPPGNDSQSGLSPKDLNLVREYIANHKSHPITIGELAALVCLSEYHFIRSFKKSAGMTPYRYILHKRLELARDLILDTKMRLVDIAIACGFSSQSHMTRLFKRHFHQTPMEARRSLGA